MHNISLERGALNEFLKVSPAHQDAVIEIAHALHNQLRYAGVPMDDQAVALVRDRIADRSAMRFMETDDKYDEPTQEPVAQITVDDIVAGAVKFSNPSAETTGIRTIFMRETVGHLVATHFKRLFVASSPAQANIAPETKSLQPA